MDTGDLTSSDGEIGAGMGFAFLSLALVLASGVIGFVWHQQGWWPAGGSDSQCQEIRALAEEAEEIAVTAGTSNAT